MCTLKQANVLFFCCVLVLSACVKREEPLICTDIFSTVGIKVNGKKLDTSFTIRILTGDTLRPHQSGNNAYYYSVLDDSYRKLFEDRLEKFLFIGLINDSVRVEQVFEIAADKCHIKKVSGPEQIDL